MATYEVEAPAPVVIKDPSEALPAKIGRFVTRLPVHIFLMFIAVLWLMPTLGLFLESLM